MELPEGADMEALQAFWEQIEERENKAAEIVDDIFPIKEIYLYYGVTAEDIKNETKRYKSLLGVLCS